MKLVYYFVLIVGVVVSCANPRANQTDNSFQSAKNPTNKVVLFNQIKWEKLNPARGDKSPQAGTIWGDRKGNVPTGFLVKFVAGFSSPPHIHNVSYRAVVIKGLVHNDDPKAENMWMPPGSFWTQPQGEVHITSAKSSENIAYVEIDQGPYLVKSVNEAFDNGEQPINIDASNVVWLNHEQTNWVDSKSVAEISFLWESTKKDGMKGLFVKLPKAFSGKIESTGTILHAVVVKGAITYEMPQNKQTKTLDTGSYFGATSSAVHKIANTTENEIVVYLRTNGELFIK